jgi:hypothetical protein
LVSLSSIEKASNEKIRNYKIDNVEKIMRLKKKREEPGANVEEIEAELKQCHIKSEEIDEEFLRRGVFHALFAPKIVSVGGSLELESSFNDDDLSAMTSVDDDEDSSILNQALQMSSRRKTKGRRIRACERSLLQKLTGKK